MALACKCLSAPFYGSLSGMSGFMAGYTGEGDNGALWRSERLSRRIDIHSKDFKHA